MTVRMTHPDLPDQPIQVLEAAVPVHRASGWRTDADNGITTPEPPATAPEPAAGKRRTESTATTGKE